jgi:hypothetical protein
MARTAPRAGGNFRLGAALRSSGRAGRRARARWRSRARRVGKQGGNAGRERNPGHGASRGMGAQGEEQGPEKREARLGGRSSMARRRRGMGAPPWESARELRGPSWREEGLTRDWGRSSSAAGDQRRPSDARRSRAQRELCGPEEDERWDKKQRSAV